MASPIWTITATTVALVFTAPLAMAELTVADRQTISTQNGLRVVSSDGAVIGLTDGVSFQKDRTRLYLLARGGSIFRIGGGGKDIVVTTYTDTLSLRGSDIVLNADKQRVRNKANGSFTDDSAPFEILLLDRR